MKNLRLLSFILLLLVCASAKAQITTFSYTGSTVNYTVPPGITTLYVDVKGAAGGASFGGNGGCGEEVTCSLTVVPGTVIYVNVGGMGGAPGYSGGAGGQTGPFVSGGAGGTSLLFGGGAGGGGASDIRIGGTGLANRVVVAGGGGGGGDDCGIGDDGGNAGGTGSAANGTDCGSYSTISCGGGASGTGGGAGSTGGGMGGAVFTGGAGIGSSTTVFTSYGSYYFVYSDGGGGGGGYYGGGGGSSGGGGGGSSYATATATSVTYTSASTCATDGQITINAVCGPPTGGTITGPATVCTSTPTITYTDATGTPGGTWSSSTTTVASISPSGVLTPLAPGTTTITYSITSPCGTASATTNVTVVSGPAPITGGRFSLCNQYTPGQPDTLFDATPGGTWSSGTPSVANIDATQGIIYTAGPGTTVISYSITGCSATATVTVMPNPPLFTGPRYVCRASTITLSDATPGGTWSSTSPGVASVGSSSGIVSAVSLGAGSTYIVYTAPNGCDTLDLVSVSLPPVTIIGSGVVCQGASTILTDAQPSGTWSVSSPGIVSTSPSSSPAFDIITGVSAGVVTITYSTPSCPYVTFPMTVNPGPAPIVGPSAVCVGGTTTLVESTTGGVWSSSDTAVHVDTAGNVTSTSVGSSSVISYTLPTGCAAQTTVNVNVGPPAITGPSSVCVGHTDTLADADTTHTGIWSSTNLGIAQVVDSSGVVTGIGAGTVNISYTLPSGCFAEMPFVVNPPVTPMITISNNPGGILCRNDWDTFYAHPVNGGTPRYQWTKFSVPIVGATDSAYWYQPIHGDVINCIMTASSDVCALTYTAMDSFWVNVYPDSVQPIVTITTSSNDTVGYVGQIFTFYASVTWGGSGPTATTYQWYHKNGTALIPGATSAVYTTAVYYTDTFVCVVNGNVPCPFTPVLPGMSNRIIIYDFVGVKPLATGNDAFSLFPNPNNGTFTLTGSVSAGATGDVGLEVTDMIGQVVYRGKTTPQNGKVNAQISLDNLASGSYMLRVLTDQGNETLHFVVGK